MAGWNAGGVEHTGLLATREAPWNIHGHWNQGVKCMLGVKYLSK